MDLKDFIIEYDNIVKHLQETTPSSYIRQPDGCYGWDNVAKYQQMNRQASLERENSIHKRALELVTAWAKVQVEKYREDPITKEDEDDDYRRTCGTNK